MLAWSKPHACDQRKEIPDTAWHLERSLGSLSEELRARVDSESNPNMGVYDIRGTLLGSLRGSY